MSAPRRSREVHTEPQSRYLYDHRVAPPMWTVRPVERETYTECVCEEPCRYCKCEPT